MEPASPESNVQSALRGWLIGLATAAALVVACLWGYYPPPPERQTYTIEFGPIVRGTSEPLVVTGQFGDGDFLYVRYLDNGLVAVGYDRWGSGGPVSESMSITPGTPHRLDLRLPSLSAVRGNTRQPDPRLEVSLDGHRLIDTTLEPHLRRTSHLWFGENPIGGSACGPSFSGKIYSSDGTERRGNVRKLTGWGERVQGWLRYRTTQPIATVLIGLLVGWLAARTTWRSFTQRVGRLGHAVSEHRTFVVCWLACTIVFGWFATYGTWRFLEPDSFGVFYDYQAQSFLVGHLDVPGDALSGESFVSHGKIYGYFGVTPALLRLPFAVFGICFGELTRPALLVAFAGSLLGAYLILRDLLRLINPSSRRPSGWLTALFVTNAGLGSTLLFLSSRAYVYHEAIAWGVMFAVFACWFTLRYLREPERRWWIPALLCGTLSVHARPPSGLYGLTILGVAAAFLLWRSRHAPRAAMRHITIGALAVCGVLSFNGVSYLKFGTFEGCPLRMNVQYTPERLARIDGKQFHAVNIPFVFSTYFIQPGVQIAPHFPWVSFGGSKAGRAYAMAKMDMTEATASVPAVMTGLAFLILLGGACAWMRARELRLTLAVVWLSAVPLVVAMCAAIATSLRYTGDFCPFLITAAAVGLVGLSTLGRGMRTLFVTITTLATVWAVCAMLALTFRNQGELVWGVPDGVQERYQQWRDRIDHLTHQSPHAR